MDKSQKSLFQGMLESIKNILCEKEGIREYRAILDHFLKDGVITGEELDQLKFIEENYDITQKESRKLQKNALIRCYEKIIFDKKISEHERKSMEELMSVFSLLKEDINFDQNCFSKYYTLGLIEEGLLPEIPEEGHGINVQFEPDEILHFGALSLLRKFKKIPTHINYGGLTASIKICKGVRYRVGRIGFKTDSREILDVEASGIFYITSKNTGFKGERKNFSIPHNKIVSFELTDYGLVIFKQGKESPYILTLEDYEVPLSIISFILNK